MNLQAEVMMFASSLPLAPHNSGFEKDVALSFFSPFLSFFCKMSPFAN